MSTYTNQSTLPLFSCILARDKSNGGIGYQDKLPWKLNEDMEHFKRVTTTNSDNKENIVIMGRKTWEGLGKPLPNRINIVVSKNKQKVEGVHFAVSLDDALSQAKSFGSNRYIFVIGGTGLYRESFLHPKLETIYSTDIDFFTERKYDTFFGDRIPSDFQPDSNIQEIERDDCIITFTKWNRFVVTDEVRFLKLLSRVSDEGEERGDRTKVGTLSLFGPQIEFDISTSFPLLTTKRVPLRVVFEELIWFLRGQTQNKILNDKNVHIWDGNSSPEYMSKIGLSHYPPGELGPIYGAQWRNFGGKHIFDVERHIANGEIDDEGFDQVADVINQLKNNPTSRRMVVSAWNPTVLNEVSLPACHIMWQLYVRKGQYLDCKVIIRSNDLFLGAPFNIASYSMLTYMIAAMTGYTPGRLVYSIGDAHIYSNHLEQVKEQLSRPVRSFPKLTILRVPEKIEDFEFSNFKLEEYEPHPTIHGEMAV